MRKVTPPNAPSTPRPSTPLGPQGRAVLFGWSGSPLPQSDISNRAVFEVFGWVPPLSAVGVPASGGGSGVAVFDSGSPSVSSSLCICIPNKQEIVFICMQMCLSPRLRF